MYCRNCGKEISDYTQFCTYCGANKNQGTQSGYSAAPTMSPEVKSVSVAALIWGIVAVVVCQLPLGFIFGIIGQRKAREAAEMGIENGMVKAGRIMSKIGLIVGIVLTAFWILYILFIVGMLATVAVGSTYWN